MIKITPPGCPREHPRSISVMKCLRKLPKLPRVTLHTSVLLKNPRGSELLYPRQGKLEIRGERDANLMNISYATMLSTTSTRTICLSYIELESTQCRSMTRKVGGEIRRD
jgi:hypothetical protein